MTISTFASHMLAIAPCRRRRFSSLAQLQESEGEAFRERIFDVVSPR